MERQDWEKLDLDHWLGLDTLNPTKKARHHHRHRQRGEENARTVEKVRTVDKPWGIIDQMDMLRVMAVVYINTFDLFRRKYQAVSNEPSKMVRYFPLLADFKSNMYKAIHIGFLLTPSESALKLLFTSRLDSAPQWGTLSHDALSLDATMVLQAYQSLEQIRDLDGIIDETILSITANNLVNILSRCTIEKLSAITWHFDSSGGPSKELSDFLRQPSNNAIWKAVHQSYQTMTKQRVSFQQFKASHDFLLYPALGSGL